MLSLLRPGNTSVLRVHRDEAARYLHFARDLRWGRTLTLAVAEGLRKHTFACSKSDLQVLLDWLPGKTDREKQRDIRYAGGAVMLFGFLHLLLPESLSGGCGALLIAVGGMALIRPIRLRYLHNGLALIGAGLWGLFPWTTVEVDPRMVPVDIRLIPVVVGSLLIVWGIQQIAMLGPEQELRSAREVRDEKEPLLPWRSRLVGRMAVVSAVFAVIFAAYAIAVTHLSLARNPGPAMVNPLLSDIVIFAVLSALSFLTALVLRLRKRPPYLEAKVCGQLLVSVVVLTCWGFALDVAPGAGPVEFTGAFSTNYGGFLSPYVWMLLIFCVVLFNRWFTRAVDRELEEQRG